MSFSGEYLYLLNNIGLIKMNTDTDSYSILLEKKSDLSAKEISMSITGSILLTEMLNLNLEKNISSKIFFQL